MDKRELLIRYLGEAVMADGTSLRFNLDFAGLDEEDALGRIADTALAALEAAEGCAAAPEPDRATATAGPAMTGADGWWESERLIEDAYACYSAAIAPTEADLPPQTALRAAGPRPDQRRSIA